MNCASKCADRRRRNDIRERSRVREICEVILPNRFDDRLWLRNFRMTKTAFEMLRSAGYSSYMPTHQSHDLSRQSHMTFFSFFCARRCLYHSSCTRRLIELKKCIFNAHFGDFYLHLVFPNSGANSERCYFGLCFYSFRFTRGHLLVRFIRVLTGQFA